MLMEIHFADADGDNCCGYPHGGDWRTTVRARVTCAACLWRLALAWCIVTRGGLPLHGERTCR